MSDYERARNFYQNILLDNGYNCMSMIWTIDCVENSLQAYDMDLIISDNERETMCHLVLNGWLDCEVSIGVSQIADIVVSNWSDLKDNEDADEDLQELIRNEVLL